MTEPVLQGFKLSPQQRRWWALQAQEAAGWVEAEIRIVGPIEREKLVRALERVAARHEALRTVFPGAGVLSLPLQAVSGAVPGLGAVEGEPDFERGPLVAWRLEPGAEGGVLRLQAPGILLDGGSARLLFEEIAAGYAGSTEESDPPLQYLEFCAWQDELVAAGDEEAAEGKAFWTRQERPAAGDRLVGETVRRELAETASGSVEVEGATALSAALERAAATLGVEPRTVLLTAWIAFLFRFTGNGTPVVGAGFDGRKFEDLAGALGPFTRILPVRVRLEEGSPFSYLVARVAEAESEVRYWQEYAPWDWGYEEGSARPVFPFSFEHDTWPADLSVDEVTFSFASLRTAAEPFRFRLAALQGGGRLSLRLDYDPAAVDPGAVHELARSFAALLHDALARPETVLRELNLLDAAARESLVVELNRVEPLPEASLPLHERFRARAALHPQAPAVSDGSQELSYGELEERSNRLAHHLCGLGAAPEMPVALWLDRSVEVVVALLAILKSGAAFLPLDPSFPPERLALMVEEAGAPLVLTQEALAPSLPDLPARVVVLEAAADAVAARSAAPPAVQVLPESLAYVLFTSGSTGRPKGVAVEHRQLAAYLDAILARMAPGDGASYALVSTFAADLGYTSVFPALATGGLLQIIGHDEARDAEALARRFSEHPVDVLKIVPSHLEALLAAAPGESVWPRRRLLVGGEAASPALVGELRRRAACGLSVFNHYGPTETTVGVTTHEVAREEVESEVRLPLGRPLASGRIYLLDRSLRPVPAGMTGEIHIGGAGVARGYLGRPELTAERFLPNPFGAPGGRLYRSGDLARFSPRGAVELLGRADHQVKIRGHRVELAEVEAVLGRHAAVREAVAVVREDRPGERRLVAYVVPRGRGEAPPAADLRAFVACHLPEAMVPSVFHLLPGLPLTPNGKVDRTALPEPERPAVSRGDDRPRCAAEETLAGIWEQVLGIERVGIHDNFFELGGDSILIIQVVARAGRAGLRLQPNQMFTHQTVAELAAVVQAPAATERGEVEDAPLTPIQHWFFEQEFADPHHWNQSALYEVAPGVGPELARRVFAALYAHHSALRLHFEPTPSGRRLRVASAEEPPFGVVDLTVEDLQAALSRTQENLDLERGPLVRALFLDGGPGRTSRLLLVFHHLVIDGVSWRILVEDFVAACEAVAGGAEPRLPPATTPFTRWASRLAAFTEEGGFDGEIPYWEGCHSGLEPFAAEIAGPGTGSLASERSVAASLSAAETAALLQEVPAAFRTEVNDALLAALATVLCRWTGKNRIAVDVEGHGREDLFDDLDLSRTVGWFTTHFPVVLPGQPAAGVVAALPAVRDALRAVPRRGIGFGALRYLRGEPAAGLRALPAPQVSFNYLGQFDPGRTESALFSRAAEPSGPVRSLRGHRTHLLGVVGRVDGGVLEVVWRYSEERHARSTIEELARQYLDELRVIVASARAGARLPRTEPGFDLAGGLTREQLERIAGQVGQAKV